MTFSKRISYQSISHSYPLPLLRENYGAFSLYGALKCAPCRQTITDLETNKVQSKHCYKN